MKKLSLFNNMLIIAFIIIDLVCLFKDFNTSGLSYKLVCLSFVLVLLLPKIFRYLFHIKFNVALETVFIVFVIFAQFFGCILHWYNKIYWYDSFVHFISGILSGVLGFVLLDILENYKRKNVLFNAVFIIAITMMIASCWEIFEFCSDKIFNGDTQKVLATGVNDTMKDIICAFFGSILFIGYYLNDVLRCNYFVEKLLK